MSCPRPFADLPCEASPWVCQPRKCASGCGVANRLSCSCPPRWRKRSATIGFIFSAGQAMFVAMDSRELALCCRELADNRKAEDIVVLDVRKISSITDYFVVATG